MDRPARPSTASSAASSAGAHEPLPAAAFDSAYGHSLLAGTSPAGPHAHTPSLFARNRQSLLFLLSQSKTLIESLSYQPAAQRHAIFYPPGPPAPLAAPSLSLSHAKSFSLAQQPNPTTASFATALDVLSPASPVSSSASPVASARPSLFSAAMSASAAASASASGSAFASASASGTSYRPSILAVSLPASQQQRFQTLEASASSDAQLLDAASADAALVPLLLRKLNDTLSHLERLEARIADTHSRVLVTGDLNAGKSTFVNTILRRSIAPDDQQPCTALFVEVVDPHLNGGAEEVHGIYDPQAYSPKDPSSFVRHDLAELRHIVEENPDDYAILKVYCMDNRDSSTSLLHNGIVDISLIDSPGLNIDSMKTMSLFAKQEEIDVIIFVVNAENHFTLSGREFLETATKEKAYVFIVVNRFDQIRRKDRCRRDILEQIKSISERTYDNADDLVHFVSAKSVLDADLGNAAVNPEAEASFLRLEDRLRSFVLEKRSRSKLGPAKVFLGNLLSDIVFIAQHNITRADNRTIELSSQLQESAPMLQRMISLKDGVLNDIDKTIESTGALVAARAAKELGDFMTEIEPFTEGVQWDGVLRVWHYAHNLRQVVFRLATIRIRRCQDFAREQALACVSNIERMASNAMPEPPRISTDAIVAAFDQSQAVSSTPEDLALQMADLFDVSDKLDILKDYLPSLALMAGGLLGYRGFTAGLLRMAQTASYARMSKLAFAGLGLAGVGAFLYVLSDMKSGIQRKLTRKMKEHFSQTGFVTKTPEALGITSRRVLRSTIWDFQNQFQRVLAEREETIGVQYKAKLEAEQARAFFENVSRRATLLHDQLEEVELDA